MQTPYYVKWNDWFETYNTLNTYNLKTSAFSLVLKVAHSLSMINNNSIVSDKVLTIIVSVFELSNL